MTKLTPIDEVYGARWAMVLAGVSLCAAAGCSSSVSGPDDGVASAESAIVDTNGLNQNGLNQNGLNQNSLSTNSLTQNGLNQNGLNQNGLNQNGLNQNGLNQNGLNQNGLNQNGLNQNGLTVTTLLEDPNARELLQYIYSCAMPASASMQLVVDGTDFGTLYGSVGLAPEWGEEGGSCDETCQRWVSACVLARTNAYGKKVNVSIRGHHDALAVTPGETADYPIREGAYFGNIFAAEADGESWVAAPRYYACAGPGSNVPQLTMRFCSGQLDGCPINTLGVCTNVPAGTVPVCDTIDPDGTTGHLEDCHGADGLLYDEVVTVYLQAPIAACGNAVCEDGEEGAATPNAVPCPSDCHPGTWANSIDAKAFRSVNELGAITRGTAVDPNDGSVVIAGSECAELDLDASTPGGSGLLPAAAGFECGFLAKFDANGAHLWSFRVLGSLAESVAVGPSGQIAMADSTGFNQARLQRFDSSGISLGAPTVFGVGDGSGTNHPDVKASRALAFDGDGNILVSGYFQGEVYIGNVDSTPLSTGDPDPNAADVYLIKVDPSGEPVWWVSFPNPGSEFPHDMAVDAAGDVVVAANVYLYKIAADGTPVWTLNNSVIGPEVSVYGVAAGPAGSLLTTGIFWQPTDLGNGLVGPRGYFVAKLVPNAAGSFEVEWGQQAVASGEHSFDGSAFWGNNIRLTAEGNVLVGGSLLGIADLGAGQVDSFGGGDLFAVQYSGDGDFQWAKHMPIALRGDVDGMGVTPAGRVVLSGRFDGSMVVDNRIIINSVPELTSHENLYIAAFAPPCVAAGCDSAAPIIADVPVPLVVQATSSDGATAWFTPPTSLDPDLAGTSVSCDPPAGSLFPIGDTVVTCTATDAHGSSAVGTFTVNVIDKVAPWMNGVPESISVPGTGLATVVTWPLPEAEDQVDGPRPVTCAPPSGSGFAFGTTMVVCSAADLAGNVFEASFPVYVGYSWSGILQPINADGSSVFKRGSTVPVKFALTGPSSGVTDAVAHLFVAKLSNGVPGPINEAVSTSQATVGNQFAYTGGQYHFNLSTKNLTVGQYQLTIDLHDGVLRTVNISLK